MHSPGGLIRDIARNAYKLCFFLHAMCTKNKNSIEKMNIYRFYDHVSEREENVKADIFHAYITLLKQTRPQVSSNDPDAMDQGEG